MIARVVKIPNDRQLGLLSSSNEGPRHTSRVVKKNLTHGQWSCRVVCATQSADRNLVRLPRRIPSLPLKADTKMKTTNLKQTSVAKPRKWFQRRRRWHDPRKARPEGSQFPRTGWIAQLVHTVSSVAAPHCDRTGCRRRRSGDPRKARPQRSQFRDWRSRLHLREFAKNSRIFAAFVPGANRAPQFFFPRKSGSQNSTGIRCADTPSMKGDPRL